MKTPWVHMVHIGRIVACLAAAALPHLALAQTFDLNALGRAVKGFNESRNIENMSEADEVTLGRQIVASTMGNYPLVKNEALQRKVNAIGMWVALQSDRPTLPWRFAVANSDAINAFAAPGGTIIITQGLLNIVSNEAELACVLGHEIGHVTRKHHLTVIASVMKTEAMKDAATSVSKTLQDAQNNPLKNALLAEGKTILLDKPLDRSAETEADQDGVLLTAKAGYDPASCLTFMQKLASMKSDAGTLASLYKTHPSASSRAADIEAALKRLTGAAPGEGARPVLSLNAENGSKKKK